ncbi:MAG: AraC family transcriptional regulator [Calditrichaeota bacterium]|nr:MAG: AraC family transcriptional regulator [Calditrichota bacterium]
MYKGIMVSEDSQLVDECYEIVARHTNLELDLIDHLDSINPEEIYNFLFIILTSLDENKLQRLRDIQSQVPGLTGILYNHSLNFREIPDLSLGSKVKMIIGENRKTDLKEILTQISENYWRKIPYEQLGINYARLSPRMKKTMQFIESAPIRDCNIATLSAYLNISPGYFSQEFKRETHQSFRTFMQHLIDYYENIIFTFVNLPAKNISQILGYSELSSFSRSFKNRKGVSPTQYRKMVSSV